MSSNTNNSRSDQSPSREMHLLISSGGSRAILAGAGVVLACNHAGIKNWKSIGGISGGSLPTVFMSSGMDARTTVETALDVDFASLLTRRGGMLKILFASLMQRRYEKTRPRFGVLSSEKLGTFLEGKVSSWPTKYWTMACVGDDQLIFTKTGVHQRRADGSYRLLATESAPLGAAVRGSCAVPGIIDAVPLEAAGEKFWLHDGALSKEGRTPASVPERFYGARPEDIIVCDVGDGSNMEKKVNRWKMHWWKIICGELCLPQYEPEPLSEDDGYVMIEPTEFKFGSLQFTLTRDQKWQAVMSGYMGAVPALEKAGLLTGNALETARKVVREFEAMVKECNENKAKKGTISARTEELLKTNGLW